MPLNVAPNAKVMVVGIVAANAKRDDWVGEIGRPVSPLFDEVLNVMVVGLFDGGVMIQAVDPTGTLIAAGDIVADMETNVTAAILTVLDTTNGPIF